MKVIAIAAVTAGGKTTVVNELIKKLPHAKSLHFDDYSFEGEVEDFNAWVKAGADYNVWDLSPLKTDILAIKESGECDYLILDYPFAYCNDRVSEYIDCAIFIDTPLDVAMARRILRDMQNASGDEIREELDIYIRFAREAYVVMLENVRPSSDYIVDGTKELDEKVQEIIAIVCQIEEKASKNYLTDDEKLKLPNIRGLKQIVSFSKNDSLDDILKAIEYKENLQLWALLGWDDNEKLECLQVGASVDKAYQEIERNIRFMFSDVTSIDESSKRMNKFGKEIPSFKGTDKRKNTYGYIYNKYEKLVFCEINIDDFLGIDLSLKSQLNDISKDIANMIEIIKMNYAEAKVAIATRAVFWDTYRSGSDQKSYNVLIKQNGEE